MAERTTAAHVADLTGVYSVGGFTGRALHRVDGVALVVNDTKRRTLGPGDSARYVTVSRGLRSEYGGNVYGADGMATAEATAELDGCEFQHRATGIRYRLTETAPGVFAVAAVTEAGATR